MIKKKTLFHRLQQKRYSRGTYRNPYFQAPKKDPRKILFACGGGFLLLIFVAIYFYSYPVFAIQRVELKGLEPTSRMQMETQIHDYLNESHLFFFHNTNQFLFSEKKFREFISKTFAFDHLDVQIKHQVLSLSVKERTSDVVWKTNGEAFLVDLQGVVTQKIESEVGVHPLPVFVDRGNQEIAIGDHILSPDQIKHILSFQQLLSTQGIQFTETQIDLQAGKWIGVKTAQGYTIMFDPEGNLSAQSERLKTILRDTIKDTSHLQYIDLRFGDHVYYK